MSLAELALEIAEKAHAGQIDKAGRPYIEHPKQVALAFEDEKKVAVALLHDVIEDTDFDAATLHDMGIPYDVVEAVELLSKPKWEPYMDYIEPIKTNPLARAVKVEDLKHNMDMSRIENPTDKDNKRTEKYKKAFEILSK
ncbi:HD domain-containing protein [Acetobacterium fimetarium]|uniref:HD domain-containing protein n=1 Tax=Acetobacterium fimetarium TaxID=52691 RepID=A0ABR6WU14_9FIRM|nr:GTP pyrophosphokinase [Acetobacterium fimetarium]MBC3804041.1 HD domain-containing protein [Acetobacterium fimetarium]